MTAQETNLFFQNFGCRKEEGFGVFCTAEGPRANGQNLVGVKGTYFSLKIAKNGQGTAASGGLKAAGQCHSLPQAYGIRLFMMNPEDGADLFGEEEFECVGAEVEHGPAEG